MFNSVGPTVHAYYVHLTFSATVEIVVQEVFVYISMWIIGLEVR